MAKEPSELAFEKWRKTLVTLPAGDKIAFFAGWNAAKGQTNQPYGR